MEKILLLSAAYSWFAGLLTVMIVVTALFGLILFIALKPIKNDILEDSNASKKLKRREAEITVELMKNKGDKQKTDELLENLRKVRSAEQLVDELMEEDKVEDEAPAKHKKAPHPGMRRPANPAAKGAPQPAKQANAAPAQPAKAAEAKPAAQPAKPAEAAKSEAAAANGSPDKQNKK